MPKYRKRPVVVEAEQWFPGKDIHGVVDYQPPDEVIVNRSTGETQVLEQEPYPAVKTLEGVMRVGPGDWIITGVQGERYPCRDDIFRATYVPVADTEIDDTQIARFLRLAIVRSKFDEGYLTEHDAVELLRGCLSPGDESTRVDDSEWLHRPIDEVTERFGR